MGAIKYGLGRRKIRYNIIGAVCLIFLIIGYVFFLNIEDRQLGQRDATLARTDFALYLDQLRTTKGFAAYVTAFSKAYNYDSWQKEVPPFLLGRWALDTKPRRVTDEYIPASCIDALAIEDGMIKTTGASPSRRRVQFRIAGDTVEARAANGTTIPIKLVSYDMNLHHIEVTLPGRPAKLYGYQCR